MPRAASAGVIRVTSSVIPLAWPESKGSPSSASRCGSPGSSDFIRSLRSGKTIHRAFSVGSHSNRANNDPRAAATDSSRSHAVSSGPTYVVNTVGQSAGVSFTTVRHRRLRTPDPGQGRQPDLWNQTKDRVVDVVVVDEANRLTPGLHLSHEILGNRKLADTGKPVMRNNALGIGPSQNQRPAAGG